MKQQTHKLIKSLRIVLAICILALFAYYAFTHFLEGWNNPK